MWIVTDKGILENSLILTDNDICYQIFTKQALLYQNHLLNSPYNFCESLWVYMH